MMSKFCFEVIDRSMKDALRGDDGLLSTLPFVGKVVVFGGDFRQILPVIPKGTRQDIVYAIINSTSIWHSCKVFYLIKNMTHENGLHNDLQKHEFADWILKVGDGQIGGPTMKKSQLKFQRTS